MPQRPKKLPQILFEDNHLLAVNKPAGILSQGDSSKRPSLLDILKEYLKKKYNKPGNVFLGLVHRLDLPVTGAIVFARTSKAARRLHRSFLEREVSKYYIALVPPADREDDRWITEKGHALRKGNRTEMRQSPAKDTQTAAIRYKYIAGTDTCSLLIIRLLTGRKHQIRAQLAHMKRAVAGDSHYGSHLHCDNGIALHSFLLRFKHPVKDENITIIADIPQAFENLFPGVKNLKKKIIDSIEGDIKG